MTPGTRLGSYEIVTRLGRTAAIKLLLSANTGRFEREARATSKAHR